MKTYKHSCSLDCYDLCKFKISVDNDIVKKIDGDENNSFTKGFICNKGRKHLDRLYHKDRLLKPLLKINGEFQEIDFNQALEIVSNKLTFYKNTFGSQSVIHYSESGAGGFLKGIEDIFFNFYGGITTADGGTCWSAGNKAQNYDFGDCKTSDIEDILNSDTVILWGRNPYNTSIHLYERLVQAKKNNAKIVTIDPRLNETSKLATTNLKINPGSDGALAMAITKKIIDHEKFNSLFVEQHIIGFDEYKKYLDSLSLDYLLTESGITYDEILELVEMFINGKVSVFIGYGMQKYSNGGNTVRAIDALMAISGNIGKCGSGVFYSNKIYSKLLNRDPYNSSKYALNSREFMVNNFVGYINNPNNEIKSIFISKANPLNQFPNLNETIKAFNSIEFKVCFDMFMTDTAKYCDLIIPVTNTLESEDIIFSSMLMPYLMYNEKIINPSNELMDEYHFFRELAKQMKLSHYPDVTKEEYLNKVLSPINLTLNDLKKEDINLQKDKIAWSDYNFSTPSKKIEIYSNTALNDGLSPYPIYIPTEKTSDEYPLRLITPHFKDSLFSQHFIDIDGISKIYVSDSIMKKFDLNEKVKVKSKYGEIICEILLDKNLKQNLAYIFIGWNHKHGNPNFLTSNGSSEMGGQITYCDTFINIFKLV